MNDKRMTFQVSDFKSAGFLAKTLENKDVIINCLKNEIIFHVFKINEKYKVVWNNPSKSKYDFEYDFKTLLDAIYFIYN